MAPQLTRREALGGAAAALVLASCGGGDPPPARGPRPGSGAALFGSLLALQHAAVAAYGACAEVLRGDALAQTRAIREQERELAARLSVVLTGFGVEPPPGRNAEEYARTFPRLRNAADALHFADDLEQRQLRAYLDALTDFPTAGARATAADIGARQAAHLAAVRILQGLPAAEGPFVTGSL
jgi:ferritin-like protein